MNPDNSRHLPQYHENDHDVLLYLLARRKQIIINPSQDYSLKAECVVVAGVATFPWLISMLLTG